MKKRTLRFKLIAGGCCIILVPLMILGILIENRASNALEETARKVFGLYGYGELRTPVFEYTEVFKRGLGDQTEVVQKEMYSFDDRGGRSLTLRPEGTAGVMRALLGTDVMNGSEKRVFYIGPMFRGERPAAGRRRGRPAGCCRTAAGYRRRRLGGTRDRQDTRRPDADRAR